MIAASAGEWIPCPATGPLPSMIVDAGFGWLPSSGTAVVEMASANGLTLLRPDQYNPLQTTTLGTGELIRAAIDHGARRILLAAGGSATVDGGIGAAHALGWRFFDEQGTQIPPAGAGLARIASIQPPIGDCALPEIIVLADVTNTLCGETGAALVFGPQKGATPAQAALLDAGLRNLATRVRDDLQIDILSLPGGGAAGGLAAGAAAFMRAPIRSGVDEVMHVTGFDAALRGADWVLTGEGRLDEQSLRGKVVSGVIRHARTHSVQVGVLAGQIALNVAELKESGIHYADEVSTQKLSIEEAARRAPQLLENAVLRFINKHARG